MIPDKTAESRQAQRRAGLIRENRDAEIERSSFLYVIALRLPVLPPAGGRSRQDLGKGQERAGGRFFRKGVLKRGRSGEGERGRR
ncbi:MAG: hypothetical protein KME26_07790 [Oscillatoria princeps RMCB-10]|nr:hypothetical protein [Oscillatoria princeps RMCB-10]